MRRRVTEVFLVVAIMTFAAGFSAARLHCDADALAERIQSEDCIRRNALACAQLPAGCLTRDGR